MIKILLKKQLTEIFKAYFIDTKKNKARSKASTVFMFFLFAVIMIVLMGFIFGSLSFALSSLVGLGFGWLYYAIIGLLAVLFGVFGSVFSTYSGLYMSKDNDLLLSMPVPVKAIMVSRLLGVYLMGLMYSAVVVVPAVAVRFFLFGASFPEITGAVLYIILISLFVLALSCIFGYLVAKISLKLKNKSFITVVISLLFFAGYYFVYFNANTFLSNLIKNINEYGAAIKSKAYPVYVVGRAAEGSALPLVIVCAAVLLVLFLTLFIISRSFLKIATSTAASPKVKYNGKSGKVKTVKVALLYREAKRFVSSPNYMLNCGLGAVFMPAAGIFAVLKGSDIRSLMSMQLSAYEDLIYIGTAAVTFLLVSMNDVAAPSVSLEGKTLWQLRSLPVETKSVLKAKYTLQFYINAVPALFMALCMIIALRPNIPAALLLLLNTLSFCVFHAFFSLFCGLHKVNLNWTNEVVPIKQSMSVVFAVFGGFGYAVLSGVLYFPFSMLNLPYGLIIYLSAFFVINALLSALLYRWITRRGVKVLEAL